ncbi:MAG: hypothetical protein Q9224_002135 [Gallowayella concinna]
MDPTPVEADATSNYGSDFTPDEEEILHGLLQEAPAAILADGLDLVLKDINDNESPRGARIPRMSRYKQQRSRRSSIRTRKQRSHVALEVADDNSDISAHRSHQFSIQSSIGACRPGTRPSFATGAFPNQAKEIAFRYRSGLSIMV